MAKGKKKWLSGDSTYQAQLGQYKKAVKRYKAGNKLNLKQGKENYQAAKKSSKYSYGQNKESNKEDFAGRGLLRSGLYAESTNKLAKRQARRMSGLTRQRQHKKESAAMNLKNSLAEAKATKERAYQDALDRYAMSQYLK